MKNREILNGYSMAFYDQNVKILQNFLFGLKNQFFEIYFLYLLHSIQIHEFFTYV